MIAEGARPDRTAADDTATFVRQGYAVLPRLIEPALADFLWSYVHIKFASLLLTSRDRAVPNTPAAMATPLSMAYWNICARVSRNGPAWRFTRPIPTSGFISVAMC